MFLWLLAGWLLAPPVLSQEAEQQEEQEGAYLETVEVTVVNVEVFVTDKKGNQITGLSRDDFEVYEDGRPVSITNFYAVEGRRTLPTAAEKRRATDSQAAEARSGQPPPRRAETPAIAEDRRLHLVVYVDNFNIRPHNRNRVFRRLREFLLSRLDESDRTMLVSYDRSLHIRQQFTSDPQLIAAALFDLEKVTGYGVQTDSERRDILRDIGDADELRDVRWRVRQFAESQYNDLSFTIDAMEEIITSLGGLPGRKAILYVSDGIPLTPGEELYYALNQKFQNSSPLSEAREFDASRKFRQLAAQANTSEVTFYAIDAAGLRTPSSVDVRLSTEGAATAAGAMDNVFVNNIHTPLILLATQTGGQAFYNTNDVGPGLARMAGDFDSYYSLGYSPAHSGTGRYYKIEVKVKRKGLRVRHRTGYRDQPVHVRMTDGTRSTLLYGLSDNPLGIQVAVGAANLVEKNRYDVPIMVAIPLNKVVLVPLSEVHEARLRLYFGVLDEKGNLSDVHEVPYPVQISNDQIDSSMGGHIPFRTQLRMRPGPHRITVGVWDQLAAERSFVSTSVTVGQQ
jgi:VWFA-related protein